MTNKDRAEKLLDRYRESDAVGQKVYWVKASCLYQWKRDELYELLFDGAGTWGEFLERLKVPPSSAQQKLKNWQFYIIKHEFRVSELEGYDTSCLYYICQSGEVATKTQVKRLMELSKAATREDFIGQLRGEEPCAHHETEEISETVEKCRDCGKKIRQQS